MQMRTLYVEADIEWWRIGESRKLAVTNLRHR